MSKILNGYSRAKMRNHLSNEHVIVDNWYFLIPWMEGVKFLDSSVEETKTTFFIKTQL